MSVEYRDYVVERYKEMDEPALLEMYCVDALEVAKAELEDLESKAESKEYNNELDNQARLDHIAMLEEQIFSFSSMLGEDIMQ